MFQLTLTGDTNDVRSVETSSSSDLPQLLCVERPAPDTRLTACFPGHLGKRTPGSLNHSGF